MPARAKTHTKRKPQQARSRALVDAILVATERVLEQGGLDAMTTARVAEVAGVSIGSLYQYFPGKEALVAAVIERRVEQDWARFQGAIDCARGQGPRALIAELTRSSYRAWSERPGLYAALVAALEHVERTATIENTMERMGRLLAEQLDGATDLRGDPLAAVRIVMSASQGVLRDATAHPGDWLDSPARAEWLAEQVSSMICAYLFGPDTRTD